jgi:AbrB family looped-hinge helix DNA binding protein
MDRLVAIDRLGRLVIPKELRRRHRLAPGSRLRLRSDGDALVLEPLEAAPILRERDGLLLLDVACEPGDAEPRALWDERLHRLSGASR